MLVMSIIFYALVSEVSKISEGLNYSHQSYIRDFDSRLDGKDSELKLSNFTFVPVINIEL